MMARLGSLPLAAASCVTLLLLSIAKASAEPPAYASDRLLVKPKTHVKESVVQSLFAKHKAKQHQMIHQLDVRVVHVPPGKLTNVLERLRRNRNIEFAEPDWILRPAAVPNDPYYSSEWHLPRISAPSAWDTTTGSSAVTIAILDSGVDGTHPDLAPMLVPGWNFYDNNSDTRDVIGHGTVVAGAAAAAGNDGTGVAGVAWGCRLMPLRIADTNCSASASATASALTWAADHGARVANISYSGVTKIASVESAAQYFRSMGGVVVASAGNAGTFDATADNPNLLMVSATDLNDVLASWSNTGNNIDLAAPGVSILTTVRGGSYGWAGGTSVSAPIVAGAAALVMSANATLPGAQVGDILKQSADDLGAAGWDPSYGSGRVNAGRAVLLAVASTPADSAAPSASITAPSSGSTVSGPVTVNVSATDDMGVTRVECYLDGGLIGASTNAMAGFPWNTAAYPNGSCTLQARAYDAAGNVGMSAVVTVSVLNAVAPPDTVAPTVLIISPASNATVSRRTKVGVAATDNVGVTRVDLYADGSYYATSTSASPEFIWNTSKLPRGQHTLQAFAYDAAGNVGASAVCTVRK